MSHYLVIEESLCSACDGSGEIPEALQPTTRPGLATWWLVPCLPCEGTGFTRSEIDLLDAIKDLQERGLLP